MSVPSIDILFLAWRRPEFTQASWAAIRANTTWNQVRAVYFYTDGDVVPPIETPPVPMNYVTKPLGGPIAITNDYLNRTVSRPAALFAKIDNDLVLCPNWLECCTALLHTYPEVDLLGIEPTPFYSNLRGDLERRIKKVCSEGIPSWEAQREVLPCIHVGGIGMFQRRAFDSRPRPKPTMDGRWGFTRWQTTNPTIKKAWVDPPLPVFLLDHLPFEPWISLSAKYVKDGVQRYQWGQYSKGCEDLWSWWYGA